MKKVAILGTGMTTFTDLYDYDLNEMTDLALTRVYEEIEAKDSGSAGSPQEKSGTIAEEIQKGYTLQGKVVRPAKVKVVK